MSDVLARLAWPDTAIPTTIGRKNTVPAPSSDRTELRKSQQPWLDALAKSAIRCFVLAAFAVAIVLGVSLASHNKALASELTLTVDTQSAASSATPPGDAGGQNAQNALTPLPDCQLQAVQAIRQITTKVRQRLALTPQGQKAITDTTLGLGIATPADNSATCAWRARIALTGASSEYLRQRLWANNNQNYWWILKQLRDYNPNSTLDIMPLMAGALQGGLASGTQGDAEQQLLRWMDSTYPGYRPVVGATTGVCLGCQTATLAHDGIIATAVTLPADPNTLAYKNTSVPITQITVDLYKPFAGKNFYPWEQIKDILQNPTNVVSAGALQQALQELARRTPMVAADPSLGDQFGTSAPQTPVALPYPGGMPNQASLGDQFGTSEPQTPVALPDPGGMPNQASLGDQLRKPFTHPWTNPVNQPTAYTTPQPSPDTQQHHTKKPVNQPQPAPYSTPHASPVPQYQPATQPHDKVPNTVPTSQGQPSPVTHHQPIVIPPVNQPQSTPASNHKPTANPQNGPDPSKLIAVGKFVANKTFETGRNIINNAVQSAVHNVQNIASNASHNVSQAVAHPSPGTIASAVGSTALLVGAAALAFP